MDLVVILQSGTYGAEVVNPGHDGDLFGAFACHLRPILPKGKLQLVGDMPYAALEMDFDPPLESVQDEGVSCRHQEKALELLESPESLFKNGSGSCCRTRCRCLPLGSLCLS